MRYYFDAFPIIEYANTRVRDVTRRAVVAVSALSDPRVRLPLELRPGTRADTVAEKYYGDPGSTWLVYASTSLVDPAWDWYLDDEKLAALAVARFGSVEEAQRRTRRYVTNWYADAETQITPDGWTALTDAERDYWAPVLGVGGVVVAYQRRREDWSVTTNKIVDVAVESASGSFQADERAQFFVANVAVGNCHVAWSNSTHVYVKHVAGNTSAGVLTGANSGATATVTGTTVLLENIPDDVASYYDAESEWDYMVLQNELKKTVRLVDARYADEAQRELKTLLSE